MPSNLDFVPENSFSFDSLIIRGIWFYRYIKTPQRGDRLNGPATAAKEEAA